MNRIGKISLSVANSNKFTVAELHVHNLSSFQSNSAQTATVTQFFPSPSSMLSPSISIFFTDDDEWEKDLAAEIQDFEVVDDQNDDESELDDLK